MKVRYKITLVFVLFTVTALASLCVLAYYITQSQQERDFNRRHLNRTATISNLLEKLPEHSGYETLSMVDSSMATLLVFYNIHLYNDKNECVYRFNRAGGQDITVNPQVLAEARRNGSATENIDGRQIAAIYQSGAHPPVVVVTVASDENGKKNLAELTKTLMVAFFASMLLSCIAGWLFSKRLLNPVEEIALTVNTISANNIEARLTESKINDEWNKLAITFNRLLDRLQDSFEIQGRFISNASHELSTPLTAISNQIDVIVQKERSNAEYLQVLHSVRMDVQLMTDLTQELLMLARTARGGALQAEKVRIDEILMDIPSVLRKITSGYNVHLFFDELPENESQSMVQGNFELLFSAFRNLAQNGCKYSPDHTVNIDLSFPDNKIHVGFSNKYESFNPDDLDAIFQPFQRGKNAVTQPGYGLGLSLSRRIILLHKGEIKAELKEPGIMYLSVTLPSVLV